MEGVKMCCEMMGILEKKMVSVTRQTLPSIAPRSIDAGRRRRIAESTNDTLDVYS